MTDRPLRVRSIDEVPGDAQLCVVRAGRRRWRIRRRELEQLQVAPGCDIDASTLTRLDGAVSVARAMAAAVKMLERSPRSAQALRDRLSDRFGAQAAQQVVEDLRRSGLVDDAHVARSLRQSLERSGPVGARRLAQALQQHAVDPAVAQAALGQLAQEQDPMQAACAAAEAMRRSLKGLDAATCRRRLAGRLLRRGFDQDTVEEALEQLGLGANDSGYHASP